MLHYSLQKTRCCVVPVLSGMEAWSVWRSFLKLMFPSWRTEDTTFSMPAEEHNTGGKNHVNTVTSVQPSKLCHLYIPVDYICVPPF